MQKTKTYDYIRFTPEILSKAVEHLTKLADDEVKYLTLSVQHNDSEWKYDSIIEFLADYRNYQRGAMLHLYGEFFSLNIFATADYTQIAVQGETRENVESIFSIFEAACESCKISMPKHAVPQPPIVFIGHGHSEQWRDLKDHLQDKHGYQIEAYESGARAGHTIRDILEDMVTKSSFAILVLSAEDEQPDGKYRARQNIIHEAGLFQGHLGFSRAIMLLEEGVEEFSNVQGVQYIPFSKGNIKETYGEVLATLRREFPR